MTMQGIQYFEGTDDHVKHHVGLMECVIDHLIFWNLFSLPYLDLTSPTLFVFSPMFGPDFRIALLAYWQTHVLQLMCSIK